MEGIVGENYEIMKATPILKKKEGLRFLICINIVAAAVLIGFQMTPLLERTTSNYVILPIWGFWAVTTIFVPHANIRIFSYRYLIWWLVYTAWVFLMFAIGHSNEPMTKLVAQLPFYSIPIMMAVVIRCYNFKEKRTLWFAILVIFLYNLGDNLLLSSQDIEIYDRIGEYLADSTWDTNAGSTTHNVQCLFMCAIFWYISQNTNYKLVKILSIVFLIMSSYYILFINNRTISLMTWLYMIGMFFLTIRKGYRFKSMSSLLKSSIVILLIVIIFAAPLIEILLSVFADSDRMSGRLEQLLSFSSNHSVNSGDSDLYARYILWLTSIQTFFSSIPNFLVGVGEDVHQGDVMGLVRSGVGYHSEFFDLAAKYGIIGVIMVTSFLKHLFSFLRKLCGSDKEITMLNIILMGFILYSFFNCPFRGSIFFVLFIFMPLTIQLVRFHKI